MKIVKPDWINDSTPIISCDIHPDGSRFALGGSTKDAGKIQIWNMAPILDKARLFILSFIFEFRTSNFIEINVFLSNLSC